MEQVLTTRNGIRWARRKLLLACAVERKSMHDKSKEARDMIVKKKYCIV